MLINEKFNLDFRSIHIAGGYNVRVEGVTITNAAYHSFSISGDLNRDKMAEVSWVKIFTWRVNGDGINPHPNTVVHDCFIRTQDDSLYVNGGIARVILWQAN